MKQQKIKTWLKALWLFIWYKPFFKKIINKQYDEVEGWYDNVENRWYIKKRPISWILLFVILFIPIFVLHGINGWVRYFKRIYMYQSRWVTMKKEIDFKTKLGILIVLWK